METLPQTNWSAHKYPGESGAWWVVDVRGPHRITRVSITSGENNGKSSHTYTHTHAYAHKHTHTHAIFFYNYVLVHRRAASKFLHTSWGHLQWKRVWSRGIRWMLAWEPSSEGRRNETIHLSTSEDRSLCRNSFRQWQYWATSAVRSASLLWHR